MNWLNKISFGMVSVEEESKETQQIDIDIKTKTDSIHKSYKKKVNHANRNHKLDKQKYK